MEIETNIKPINIRLDQKNQKLGLRMLKMHKNHPTRLKIPNFPLENWNEVSNDQPTEFVEWNQVGPHAAQLTRVAHSVSSFIVDEYLIEECASIQNIWKKTHLDLSVNQDSNTRENHLKDVETIARASNSAIFYTDVAHDSRTKISIASCVLYHNSHVAYKTWNLEIEMSIDDAELYAIEKATKWTKTLRNSTHIWIFTDSQNAIQSVENSTHFLANEIYETIEKLHDVQFHIQWIPRHANILGNERADQLARSVFSSNVIARDKFLSFKHLNAQITEHNHQRWLNLWKNNSKKDKHYEKFETKLDDSKIQFLSKKFTKHVISTIMQLKLEHDYFKSYLIRLSNYDTKKCNENCNLTQSSKHLLLHCHHLTNDRSNLIKNMKSQNTTLKTLFETKKSLENLRIFLINTEIATRKWILSDVDEENDEESV
jgi:ribonuclease HI